MTRTARMTPIKSSDFEALVSDMAAAIWNQLIEQPAFYAMQYRDFTRIFEAVSRASFKATCIL